MFKASLQSTWTVFTAAILFLFSLPAFSSTRTPLEERLLAVYKDKPQMLQGFYCGTKLRFDADAKLRDGGQPGSWTVCGDVHIEDIEIKNDEVRIKAQRVYLYYDPRKISFQDVELLVPQKEKNNKTRQQNRQLEIHIARPVGADEAAIQSSLDKLFRPADKDFSDIAPDYWKPYLQGRKIGKRPETIQKEEQLPLLKPIAGSGDSSANKKITVPHVISSPNPDFSQEAREYRFQGTVLVKLLIDSEGKPANIWIIRPLGLGLDEKAVEAIKKWKFVPEKDSNAKPVESHAEVEVNFRLY
jgi:TonB family protein